MTNEMVLREAGVRQFTCIILERQLRLHEHLAQFPAKDPADQILSCRDPQGWTMPRVLPHVSWLRQVEFI